MDLLIFIHLTLLSLLFSVPRSLVSSSNIDTIQNEMSNCLDESCDEPLILTPYLERNQIEAGKRAAKVRPFIRNVRSYSGYFTVDKKYNSNMFFWYFPAEKSPESAPVIVWLQGGPGGSSLYGLFRENGPYRLVNGVNIAMKEIYWSKSMHVIYIDNPVGTGFSFTDCDEGYATDEETIGNHLYSVMLQFFQLFPNLLSHNFFVSGESYAGKYVPALCYTIHRNNPTADKKIKLKGLAIGNGLCDPINQLDYGIYLYEIGLIDENEKVEFDLLQNKTIAAIRRKDWVQAFEHIEDLMLTNLSCSRKSLFEKYTGFSYYYNFLMTKNIPGPTNVEVFLNLKSVQEHIHVGHRIFRSGEDDSFIVYVKLKPDWPQSIVPWLSVLMDNYKVLMYNGQMDIIIAYPLVANYLNKIDWCGSCEFLSAERMQWKVEGDLAGYIKTSAPKYCNGSLSLALVRNAGHMVPVDQPLWAYSLISDFVFK